MKKTLVLFAVMASAATAEEPVVYDSLLSSTEGWTLGSIRGSSNLFTIDTGAKTLTLTNSNWSQTYANYSLPTTLTATESQGIGFTFDVKINDIVSSLTFSLIGTTQAITLGTNYDQDDLFVGTTSVTTSNAYSFKAWADAGTSTTVTGSASIADVAPAGSSITISGSTKYDAETGHHVLTLMCGDKSTTLDLGESVDVTRISFGGDGDNNRTNFVVSNLSLYTVPEPATATLSLLALAGLAIRRRRKQA